MGMIIKRLLSLRTLVVLAVGLIFVKIYQHNLLIKLMYQGQRCDRTYALYEKDRNELLVALYEYQSPNRIMQASQKRGMAPLKMGQIVTALPAASVDMLTTTSSAAVLLELGLTGSGIQGGAHVSTGS